MRILKKRTGGMLHIFGILTVGLLGLNAEIGGRGEGEGVMTREAAPTPTRPVGPAAGVCHREAGQTTQTHTDSQRLTDSHRLSQASPQQGFRYITC